MKYQIVMELLGETMYGAVFNSHKKAQCALEDLRKIHERNGFNATLDIIELEEVVELEIEEFELEVEEVTEKEIAENCLQIVKRLCEEPHSFNDVILNPCLMGMYDEAKKYAMVLEDMYLYDLISSRDLYSAYWRIQKYI